MRENIKGINGNVLKIIGAISMLIDHLGAVLFPKLLIFKIIGRLAYPIFAFFISEGCKYTGNKLRYFLTIFGFGSVFQIVYYLFTKDIYLGILLTFSISILIIYALQYLKKNLFSKNKSVLKIAFSLFLFIGSIIATYFLNRLLLIDYGFWGCLGPVFASLFDFKGIDVSERLKRVDCNLSRVVSFSIPLLMLGVTYGGFRYFSLMAIPLLLCYSGKRGKYQLKYFFYIFYPVHLAIIYAIAYFLYLY